MSGQLYRRFWFRFRPMNEPTPLNLGCGVTAVGYEDALALMKDMVFAGAALPEIVECVEDVDVMTLDPGKVRSNIGVVGWRGVWFPLGDEPTR